MPNQGRNSFTYIDLTEKVFKLYGNHQLDNIRNMFIDENILKHNLSELMSDNWIEFV